MSFNNPERLIFKDDIAAYELALGTPALAKSKPYVSDARGWILFGTYDIRGRDKSFLFCLQKLPKQKEPRVRVGCRYYTLAQAYNHWDRKVKKACWTNTKNEGRQALAIISLMLLQAQAYGLISMYAKPIKFDRTILKRKRRC